MDQSPTQLPADVVAVVPMRNVVLFPNVLLPISVGRAKSIAAVQYALQNKAPLGIVLQKDPRVDDPGRDDLYAVGTLANVVHHVVAGDGLHHAVCQGVQRFRVKELVEGYPFVAARIERIEEPSALSAEAEALGVQLQAKALEILQLLPGAPAELAQALQAARAPGQLADITASLIDAELPEKQALLETVNIEERLHRVLQVLARRIQVLRLSQEIGERTKEMLDDRQRKFLLREQLKTIQKELGEEGNGDEELAQLEEAIAKAGMPAEAEAQARKELRRLKSMGNQSAEYSMLRTWIEWMTELPWKLPEDKPIDLAAARATLEADHFGLERVKKRIVEFSAIRQLRRDKKGPILLFVGPPGVGKTSLGRSIARAMGRRYGRIALGGVRDEAEVRGHRRTYVGALPGRIIQALKKVGTKNPVLVLDEVDKMGVDMRGDPAAALLEVLDPEQNDTFVDHYIDVPFDLSSIMFLATANYFDNIPAALRDRMEVIEVPGYTRTEKRAIAEQFLVPKQLKEHALKPEMLSFAREGVEAIIDYYTREAGVRGLEREIAAVCRDAAVRLAEGQTVQDVIVDKPWVEQVLGVHKHNPEIAERRLHPGAATGLSVTASGGDLLLVEVTRMPGKGEITVTGGLRNVMKESAATALSFVRSKAELLKLEPEFLRTIDLHVHVPKGGSARDAASAGVAIFVAVASLLLDTPVKPDVAMSGELTLRGRILPVSGIKAMVLAAHRAGMRSLVLPARNERDLEEVPDEVKQDLEVHLVSRVDEVLPLVLASPEERGPLSDRSFPPPGSGEARP
ncbi:endopeptidase La [Betaproteobacteria bacterium PRO7]|nr:endopeptidase La [Betaproteobacteria bacterium PRO7]